MSREITFSAIVALLIFAFLLLIVLMFVLGQQTSGSNALETFFESIKELLPGG
jgi:hypothetical protein